MSIESMGYVPPSEKGEGKQNKELITRAEELATKFQEMLSRNKGEYPVTGMDKHLNPPSQEDEEVMDELAEFFEDDCKDITSVEVGKGGNYDRDELKKLSDTLWLLRRVQAEYDVDLKEYSIIDKEKAVEVLHTIIEKRKSQIKALEAQNQEAEKLLSGVK